MNGEIGHLQRFSTPGFLASRLRFQDLHSSDSLVHFRVHSLNVSTIEFWRYGCGVSSWGFHLWVFLKGSGGFRSFRNFIGVWGGLSSSRSLGGSSPRMFFCRRSPGCIVHLFDLVAHRCASLSVLYRTFFKARLAGYLLFRLSISLGFLLSYRKSFSAPRNTAIRIPLLIFSETEQINFFLNSQYKKTVHLWNYSLIHRLITSFRTYSWSTSSYIVACSRAFPSHLPFFVWFPWYHELSLRLVSLILFYYNFLLVIALFLWGLDQVGRVFLGKSSGFALLCFLHDWWHVDIELSFISKLTIFFHSVLRYVSPAKLADLWVFGLNSLSLILHLPIFSFAL